MTKKDIKSPTSFIIIASWQITKWKYSWLLNNTGLNCAGPLNLDFFFSSKYYSITPPVVGRIWGCRTRGTEEPRIQRADYIILGFWTSLSVSALTPVLFKDQLYSVLQILLTVFFAKICHWWDHKLTYPFGRQFHMLVNTFKMFIPSQ